MAVRSNWFMRWVRRRVLDPLMHFVRRGTEPKQLAFSGALGITLGIFPVYGATALLCAFAALVLRSNCHPPMLMLANLVVTPIELSLIIPFLRLGEFLGGAEKLGLSLSTIKGALSGQIPHQVVLGLLYAILGWAAASPFIMLGLYVSLLPVFRRLSKKLRPEASRPARVKAAVV